MRSWVIEGVS